MYMTDYNLFSNKQLEEWKEDFIRSEKYEDVKAISDVLNERKEGKISRKVYATQFVAKCVKDGKFYTYAGDRILAYSENEAQEYCDEQAPYLKVIGQLLMEIPAADDDLLLDYGIEYIR